MTNLFIRADGTTLIGKESILSCEYVEQVNTSDDFSFGCASSSSVTVEVRGSLSDAVKPGEKISYYQVEEDETRTLVGVFYVDKPTISSKTSYKFSAYDSISMLDADLSAWLYAKNSEDGFFPLSLSDFAMAVCTQCGVVLNTTTFPNSSYQVHPFYSDGLTGRDLMSMVAELAGRYLKCDTSGNLMLEWYEDNTSVRIGPSNKTVDGITTLGYFSGELSYENYQVGLVKRVQIHDADSGDIGVIYPADADGATYEVSDNILLTGSSSEDRTEIARVLYEQISSFTYTPATFRVRKNTLIHTGDRITVTDANGNSFSTLVMKLTHNSSGVYVESTGNENRDSSAAVVSRKYENIYGKMLSVEMTCEGLKVQASDLSKQVATLSVTTDGIMAEVQKELDGMATSIEQTLNSIKLEVTTKDGVSTFTLSGTGIKASSAKIDLSGYVTFTGLSGGTTTIDGACIKTGTISADRINLTGAITWSDLSKSVQNEFGDGLTEDDVSTLITRELVSSPNIAGGKFKDIKQKNWIEMGQVQLSNGVTTVAYFNHYCSGYSTSNPVFVMGYTNPTTSAANWVMAPFNNIVLDYLLKNQTMYASGNWDFSGATVSGLDIEVPTDNITVVPVWG